MFPYQYLKNTAEHTSDLVSRFPELSTSTHFLKFTVKCVFAVQLGTSQGSEGSPGSKDHRQGAGEVPGRPPNVCGQKRRWSGVLQGTEETFWLQCYRFQVLKNDIDINAEGVAIFTQLLIRYYGYLWKCMYLVSLKKTKTNPCPDHILSLLDSMWLEPSKKTGRSKILGQMSRSLQTVKFLT